MPACMDIQSLFMEATAQILLTLGGILLLGMATDVLGQRTFLPRVTLMLLFGMLIGPGMLDLIPAVITNRFELIASMALLMVGFLLGGRLTRDNLQRFGREIIAISATAVIATTLMVFLGLVLVGVPLDIAILLGCIASATAPAATVDIVMESGYTGRFADLLLAVVALDDAWGLIIFSMGLALVAALAGVDGHSSPLLMALRDIGGAALLGLLIGLPAAYMTGRIRPGQPMLTEALGLVFGQPGNASRVPLPCYRGHRMAVHGHLLRAGGRIAGIWHHKGYRPGRFRLRCLPDYRQGAGCRARWPMQQGWKSNQPMDRGGHAAAGRCCYGYGVGGNQPAAGIPPDGAVGSDQYHSILRTHRTSVYPACPETRSR
jgi:hypothetical protein